MAILACAPASQLQALGKADSSAGGCPPHIVFPSVMYRQADKPSIYVTNLSYLVRQLDAKSPYPLAFVAGYLC